LRVTPHGLKNDAAVPTPSEKDEIPCCPANVVTVASVSRAAAAAVALGVCVCVCVGVPLAEGDAGVSDKMRTAELYCSACK
jgi:hypothetical protein